MVDLGSIWGYGMVKDDVEGRVWSVGSSRIIYERDRLKNRGPVLKGESTILHFTVS